MKDEKAYLEIWISLHEKFSQGDQSLIEIISFLQKRNQLIQNISHLSDQFKKSLLKISDSYEKKLSSQLNELKAHLIHLNRQKARLSCYSKQKT
jgi:hypothetical protein